VDRNCDFPRVQTWLPVRQSRALSLAEPGLERGGGGVPGPWGSVLPTPSGAEGRVGHFPRPLPGQLVRSAPRAAFRGRGTPAGREETLRPGLHSPPPGPGARVASPGHLVSARESGHPGRRCPGPQPREPHAQGPKQSRGRARTGPGPAPGGGSSGCRRVLSLSPPRSRSLPLTPPAAPPPRRPAAPPPRRPGLRLPSRAEPAPAQVGAGAAAGRAGQGLGWGREVGGRSWAELGPGRGFCGSVPSTSRCPSG
jgi:hypothetical protein